MRLPALFASVTLLGAVVFGSSACGGSAAPLPDPAEGTPSPDRATESAPPNAADPTTTRKPDPVRSGDAGALGNEYFNVTIGDIVRTVVAKRAVTWSIDGGANAMVLATGFEQETPEGSSSTSVYFPVNASGAVPCDERTRIEHTEAAGRVFSTRILNSCTINVVTSNATVTASFRGWIDNGSIPAAAPVTVQGSFRIVQGTEAH